MENNKEYIPLQSAHITQVTSNGRKTEWQVKENITHDTLWSLSKRLTEAEIFDIMKFARKFELEAFNIGIDFGKQKQREVDNQIIAEYKARVMALENENSRLADVLDSMTKKEI